jgi:ribonuclease VapC
MMVIDTSALIAIQFGEPEAKLFLSIIRPRMMVGAPTLLEYYLVVGSRYGDIGRLEAEALVERLDLVVVNFTEDMVKIASDAFMRFGKGKHKAKLNFGDCMAYALAKELDAPLLFKGGDFALTDIKPAA